jgi:hypothetical protein
MEAASFCGKLLVFFTLIVLPQKIQRTARPVGKRHNLLSVKKPVFCGLNVWFLFALIDNMYFCGINKCNHEKKYCIVGVVYYF